MPGLAISLASMADAEEAHGVIVNGEQDAVIANAEAKPSAEVALERDDIPGAGARKRRMPSKMRMAVGWSDARTSALASPSHSIR